MSCYMPAGTPNPRQISSADGRIRHSSQHILDARPSLQKPTMVGTVVPPASGCRLDMEVAWVWPPCLPCTSGQVQLAVQVRLLKPPHNSTRHSSKQQHPGSAAPRGPPTSPTLAAQQASSQSSGPASHRRQPLRLQVLHMGQVIHTAAVLGPGAVLLSFQLPADLAPVTARHGTPAAPPGTARSSSGTPSNSSSSKAARRFGGVLSLVLASEVAVGPALPLLVLDKSAAEDFQVLFRALVDEELGRQGEGTPYGQRPGLVGATGTNTEAVISSSSSSRNQSAAGAHVWQPLSGAAAESSKLQQSSHHQQQYQPLDRVMLLVQSELRRSSLDSSQLLPRRRQRDPAAPWAGPELPQSTAAAAGSGLAPLSVRSPAAEAVEAAFRAVWARELLLLVTDLRYLLLCVPDEFKAGGWDAAMYLRTLSQLLDQLQQRRMWSAMAVLLRHVNEHGLEVMDASQPLDSQQLTPAYLQDLFGCSAAAAAIAAARSHALTERSGRRSIACDGTAPALSTQQQQQQQRQQQRLKLQQRELQQHFSIRSHANDCSRAWGSAPGDVSSTPAVEHSGAAGQSSLGASSSVCPATPAAASPPDSSNHPAAFDGAAAAAAGMLAQQTRRVRLRRCSAPAVMGLPQWDQQMLAAEASCQGCGAGDGSCCCSSTASGAASPVQGPQQPQHAAAAGLASSSRSQSQSWAALGVLPWWGNSAMDGVTLQGCDADSDFSVDGVAVVATEDAGRSCCQPQKQVGLRCSCCAWGSTGGALCEPLDAHSCKMNNSGTHSSSCSGVPSTGRAARYHAAALARLQSLEWLPPVAVLVVLLYCLCCLPMLLPSLQQFGAERRAERWSESDWCPAVLASLVILHCLVHDVLADAAVLQGRALLPLLLLHRATAAVAIVLAVYGVHCVGVGGMQHVVVALIRGW